MRRWSVGLLAVAYLLGTCTTLPATIVQYDIRPLVGGQPIVKESPQSQPIVSVRPESEVGYQVTVRTITSPEDPAFPVPIDPDGQDNNGLSFFRFDILTTLGVLQQPADRFVPPADTAFTLLPSLGTVSTEDILELSGAQDTVGFVGGTPTPGIGLDETQPIVEGRLLTGPLAPNEAEAEFLVRIGPVAQASVFQAGTLAPIEVPAPNIEIGEGFIIRVTTDIDDDDDDNDDNDDNDDDDDDNDNDNDFTPIPLPEVQAPIGTAVMAIVGVTALTFGIALMMGPVAGAVGLVAILAALLFLITSAGV